MRHATLTLLACAGLALALGYLLATPYDTRSLMVVGLTLAVMSVPVLLRWHYWLLLLSWNASVLVFFLPGRPQMWMLLAAVSLGLSVMAWLLRDNLGEAGRRVARLQLVPTVAWTLVLLGAVVLATAVARGGIGIRSLGGSTYGGRHYIYIFAAIVGFFAISCQAIPPGRARLAVLLFLIGALTHPISNLVYLAGPSFYWLFNLFPVEFAVQQAITESAMSRFNAVTFAMTGIYSWMLAHYGVAGLFDWRRPWRLVVFTAVVVVSLFGGFRSAVVFAALVFGFQFWLEGLWRTRLMPLIALGGAIVCVALVPLAPRLPFPVQRALSFLPIEMSPLAKGDAAASTDWRLRMWRVVWADVPKYLWLGKGYSINPTDLYLVVEAQKRGLAADIDQAVTAGDYHSGPLSVLVPFGVPGVVAFLLFGLASLRVLHRNVQHGDASLRTVNAFLCACFAAKFVFFWTVFGALASDLAHFCGFVALSIALNGGVKSRPAQAPAGRALIAEPVSATA
jgi:hypothetical protein